MIDGVNQIGIRNWYMPSMADLPTPRREPAKRASVSGGRDAPPSAKSRKSAAGGGPRPQSDDDDDDDDEEQEEVVRRSSRLAKIAK